jgi:hypothetical protein
VVRVGWRALPTACHRVIEVPERNGLNRYRTENSAFSIPIGPCSQYPSRRAVVRPSLARTSATKRTAANPVVRLIRTGVDEKVYGMSYDLAFWEGPRPRDDDEASEVFEELWDALDESDEDVPPTPAIQALVGILESRWPVTDTDAPWATFPLAEEAQGATLYVNLVYGRPDHDLVFMASTARRLGIVCFDPQLEAML